MAAPILTPQIQALAEWYLTALQHVADYLDAREPSAMDLDEPEGQDEPEERDWEDEVNLEDSDSDSDSDCGYSYSSRSSSSSSSFTLADLRSFLATERTHLSLAHLGPPPCIVPYEGDIFAKMWALRRVCSVKAWSWHRFIIVLALLSWEDDLPEEWIHMMRSRTRCTCVIGDGDLVDDRCRECRAAPQRWNPEGRFSEALSAMVMQSFEGDEIN